MRHTLILEMFKVMKMEDLALEMEVCEVEIKVHYLLVMYNEYYIQRNTHIISIFLFNVRGTSDINRVENQFVLKWVLVKYLKRVSFLEYVKFVKILIS